jgi:hypothetical protein
LTRQIAAALYWLAAITIAWGAYGHGFIGVRPTRAALASVTLDPHTIHVIWIVWYFVSGAMLVCGLLLFWAWPGLRPGVPSRSAVALIIGAFYAITGLSCFVYSGGERFWLLFLAQGVLVLGSTLVLRSSAVNATGSA